MNSEKIVEKRPGWENGVESIEGGIFRKVENDWKMAYLSRSPGQIKGRITWCIELLESGKRINPLTLQAQCSTFNGAKVQWKVQGSGKDSPKSDILISVDNCQNFKTEDLGDSLKITLIAELSGGEGDLAWQHAQLFRQSLTDRTSASFVISMEISN